MKALVKAERAPGLILGQVDRPEVGPNDVLIRIRKTAICGHRRAYLEMGRPAQRTIPVPMQVGHEYVGEIVELGQEVRGFCDRRPGLGRGPHPCGHCRNCRAGRRHLCRNTVGVGVNRAGCFAEICRCPGLQRLSTRSRTTLPTSSPPSSTRSAMRPIPRSPSTWSARMC